MGSREHRVPPLAHGAEPLAREPVRGSVVVGDEGELAFHGVEGGLDLLADSAEFPNRGFSSLRSGGSVQR